MSGSRRDNYRKSAVIDSDVLFYAGNGPEESGQLFVSADAGGSWEPLSFDLPKVWRLEAVVHD
jgi:hypothetical protein